MIDASNRLAARLAAEARVHAVDGAARWVLSGAVLGAVVTVILARAGWAVGPRAVAAFVPLAVGAVVGYRRNRAQWTAAATAEALERRHPADNLVITAEALARAADHRWGDIVAVAAWSRLEGTTPLSFRPAWIRAGAAVVATAIAAALPWPAGAIGAFPARQRAPLAAAVDPPRITSLAAIVSPPAYLGDDPIEYPDATAVEVIHGGGVSVRVETTAAALRVSRDGAEPAIVPVSGGIATIALPAPLGATWLVAVSEAEAVNGSRLLTVREADDLPPVVRVVAPGRDRRMARPLADLQVSLEARDDHGLRDLHLRFTRVSGSGESLTFVDRDVPARIVATSTGQWTATAVLPLAALALEDGDLIVYRGVASDARPGSPGVESDAFIVDIGPLRSESAAGGGGEDVDPEERQAISQQMVIVKTERLHARGSRLSPEDRLAEAQGLAIEQRMVRAEFVFLMGGEVEDEVEEAAQAHDLVEGRLANQGQAALLAATRAMSRAEARLTAGDTTTALVAEREALRFLQQAFDRRRFLLRPVAERARIDPARRLQGPAPPAQPRPLPVAAPERAGGWDAVERAAAALARAQAEPTLDLVATAAGIAALDPADPRTSAAVTAMVRASTPAARAEALAEAQRLVHAAAARRLAPAVSAEAASPISGPVADALRRGRR